MPAPEWVAKAKDLEAEHQTELAHLVNGLDLYPPGSNDPRALREPKPRLP